MINRTSPSIIRVLHPITRLIIGGAQENTLYTAEKLDQLRYQIDVVCGPQTGTEGSLIEEAHQREIPLTIIPNLLRQISPIDDLKAFWQLNQMMKSGRYQIVHTHSSKAGILGRAAARQAGVPVIVHTVHGWSFHDFMPLLTRRLYICLERWMASFTDALIVVSDRDILKGLQAGIGHPEQYHRIRSAIPLDEFNFEKIDRNEVREELGIPQDAVVIGNVGRFSSQKNPLDWVRVAAHVSRVCPEVFFLLVGDGPLRGEVEKKLDEEGISGRTLLTGLRRDVSRILAAMDIFMLTSLWEGLPRVIPQAMAMKLPVLAYRADGTIEAIQEGVTGYLCQPGDVNQMSESCIRLAKNPMIREEFGKKGLQIAKQEYDLDRMIDEIDVLYQHLLEKCRQENHMNEPPNPKNCKALQYLEYFERG